MSFEAELIKTVWRGIALVALFFGVMGGILVLIS